MKTESFVVFTQQSHIVELRSETSNNRGCTCKHPLGYRTRLQHLYILSVDFAVYRSSGPKTSNSVRVYAIYKFYGVAIVPRNTFYYVNTGLVRTGMIVARDYHPFAMLPRTRMKMWVSRGRMRHQGVVIFTTGTCLLRAVHCD